MRRHSAPKEASARGRAKSVPRRAAVPASRPVRDLPAWAPAKDKGAGTTSMVAVAAAVTSAILGTISVVPGWGPGAGESFYMASTNANVLHGVAADEPLPVVLPPQPYEPEAPRQV